MFGHCAGMRIDASNLLLAAQAQKPMPGKAAAPQTAFETLDFAKPSLGDDRKQTASSGAFSRLGMQLDIKV